MSTGNAQGDTLALRCILNAGIIMRLFVNKRAPRRGDTEKDYTEASFPGYKPVTLADASAWTITPATSSKPAVAESAHHVFERSATGEPQTIHGVYYTTKSGELMRAELFDEPSTVKREHDAVGCTGLWVYGRGE